MNQPSSCTGCCISSFKRMRASPTLRCDCCPCPKPLKHTTSCERHRAAMFIAFAVHMACGVEQLQVCELGGVLTLGGDVRKVSFADICTESLNGRMPALHACHCCSPHLCLPRLKAHYRLESPQCRIVLESSILPLEHWVWLPLAATCNCSVVSGVSNPTPWPVAHSATPSLAKQSRPFLWPAGQR
jgi:hypothetical protein